MIQRNYDLYLEKKQFAAITGNFLAWEFELKDDKGGTLGLIDRNFQGFGKEIFTDAGKYVIHFGSQQQQQQQQQEGSTTEPEVSHIMWTGAKVWAEPLFKHRRLFVF